MDHNRTILKGTHKGTTNVDMNQIQHSAKHHMKKRVQSSFINITTINKKENEICIKAQGKRNPSTIRNIQQIPFKGIH